MFACCLVGWSISRLFLDVQNRGYFCHVAGFLYVCLFLALPIMSLNLFTAEPEVSDSHLFKLLPWKPLSHVFFSSLFNETSGRNVERSPRFFASPRDSSDFDVSDFDCHLLGHVVLPDPKYPRIPECPNSDLFLGSRCNEIVCYG